MKYYVFAIEETLIDGVYNEYSPQPKKFNDYSSAETYFHTRLGELSNSSSHVYAVLTLTNSTFGIIKQDHIRNYQESPVAPSVPEEA